MIGLFVWKDKALLARLVIEFLLLLLEWLVVKLEHYGKIATSTRDNQKKLIL